MRIAFFGSSLVSAYWNGAATYYRGVVKAMHERGHQVTFFEPDALERQRHRDIADPPWAEVVVYAPEPEAALDQVARAADTDLVIKAGGVGVLDEFLEGAVLAHRRSGGLVAFWDVDAPATLDRLEGDVDDPLRTRLPAFDLVLTYGGGERVVRAYEALGARRCVPIYNAVDPSTHYPVASDPCFFGELAFLANRLPDREARVDAFFFEAARALPGARFLLGGSGWEDRVLPGNVRYLGHVYTRDHNAFNVSPRAVLNVSRQSMASYGFSPATRVFEAAAAGARLISDAWAGIEAFLEPEREILVAADGSEVVAQLAALTPERARRLGERARARVLAEHTYAHRVRDLERVLDVAPKGRALP